MTIALIGNSEYLDFFRHYLKGYIIFPYIKQKFRDTCVVLYYTGKGS